MGSKNKMNKKTLVWMIVFVLLVATVSAASVSDLQKQLKKNKFTRGSKSRNLLKELVKKEGLDERWIINEYSKDFKKMKFLIDNLPRGKETLGSKTLDRGKQNLRKVSFRNLINLLKKLKGNNYDRVIPLILKDRTARGNLVDKDSKAFLKYIDRLAQKVSSDYSTIYEKVVKAHISHNRLPRLLREFGRYVHNCKKIHNYKKEEDKLVDSFESVIKDSNKKIVQRELKLYLCNIKKDGKTPGNKMLELGEKYNINFNEIQQDECPNYNMLSSLPSETQKIEYAFTVQTPGTYEFNIFTAGAELIQSINLAAGDLKLIVPYDIEDASINELTAIIDWTPKYGIELNDERVKTVRRDILS